MVEPQREPCKARRVLYAHPLYTAWYVFHDFEWPFPHVLHRFGVGLCTLHRIGGIRQKRFESAEAGAKFILLALFSSALLLYGVSLIYGATGTLYFSEIGSQLDGSVFCIFGMVLFITGMGFKISLVPFHLWTADTYEGAPTSVTAYLSVISKGSAAFVLMTVLMKAFAQSDLFYSWNTGMYWIIVASITVANLFAIRQNNLKRFMAFSAISQAGYLVLAIMDGTAQGMSALVFYLWFTWPLTLALLQ